MSGVMLKKIHDYGANITSWQERHNLLLSHENSIRAELGKIQESFVYMGYHFLDISEMKLYETVYYQPRSAYCKDVFQYAEQELDLAKTTVYNLMSVAMTFSDQKRGLKEQYRDYSFSQLVELLGFTNEQREYADPHMSVRDLRSLKKGNSVLVLDESGRCRNVQIPKELLPPSEPRQTSEDLNANISSNNFPDVGKTEETESETVTEPSSDITTEPSSATVESAELLQKEPLFTKEDMVKIETFLRSLQVNKKLPSIAEAAHLFVLSLYSTGVLVEVEEYVSCALQYEEECKRTEQE